MIPRDRSSVVRLITTLMVILKSIADIVLCIGDSRAFQRLVLSIFQYLELILQLKYEGSLYCKVSQLLHVRVLPPAPTGYGIPQLQLQCGVAVTSCSISSSHSGVWQ